MSPEYCVSYVSLSTFTAQAIAGDMAAAGREKEIDKIRRYISTIVPDPASSAAKRMQAKTFVPGEETT